MQSPGWPIHDDMLMHFIVAALRIHVRELLVTTEAMLEEAELGLVRALAAR